VSPRSGQQVIVPGFQPIRTNLARLQRNANRQVDSGEIALGVRNDEIVHVVRAARH
jgi:hypothetical protein